MKVYKLDKVPKRYKGAPALRPLSRVQQFRRYVAKRKFEIALEAYQKRQKFYRRKRFLKNYGVFVIGAIMWAYVLLVMFLQHLGFHF